MKKKGLFLIPVIGCLLIVVGVITLLLLPKKTDKEIFTSAIQQSLGVTKVKETFENVNYEDVFLNHIYHLYLDGNIKVDEQDGSLKLDTYFGKEQVYMLLDIVAKETLNMESLVKDNKVYLNVKDVTDKFYFDDLEKNLESFNEVSESIKGLDIDFEKVIGLLENSFYDVIDDKKLETTKTEKTINGKDYDVKKYSYDFTGNDLYEVLKTFVSNVKKDQKLYNQFDNILKQNDAPYAFGELLDELLDAFKSFKEIDKIFTYTIYLKGDETVSSEIVVNIPTGNASIPVSLVMNTLDDYSQIYLSVLGQKMFEGVVDFNKGTISFKVQGEEVITGSIGKDFVEIQSGEIIPTEFKLRITEKENSNDKRKYNVVFEAEDVNANFDISMEEVKDFPKVDVSDAAPFDEMPDEVKEKLEGLFGSKDYLEELPMNVEEFKGLAM